MSERPAPQTSRAAPWWLIGSFLVVFLAIGIPYWPIPYAKASLPSSLPWIGLIAAGAAAALMRIFTRAPLPLVILAAGAGVPAAVMARVVVEVSRDATSHNLWPFELVIAMVSGGVCAGVGSVVGSVFKLAKTRGNSRSGPPD